MSNVQEFRKIFEELAIANEPNSQLKPFKKQLLETTETEKILENESVSSGENAYEDMEQFETPPAPKASTSEKKVIYRSKTAYEPKLPSNDQSKYYSHDVKYIRNNENYENFSVNDSKLGNIIEELLTTEENFVIKLKLGFSNYVKIFDETSKHDLPKGLVGKKYVLLRNIEDIIDFHENEILPMLRENQNDLKKLFNSFSSYIDENKFYPHLLYTMHKKRAGKLCKNHKSFFEAKEKEFGDNLGISSFLIQPIQRITKYPLLLHEIIKNCFKNFDLKPLLESSCKTEKKMTDFVRLINESERLNDISDCNDLNLFHQGRLKKVDKFYVYDYHLQKRYKSRVFLFEKCVIYAEATYSINSEKLKFRGFYPREKIGIGIKDPGFTLYLEKRNIQDCDFEAKEEDVKNYWITLINQMIVKFFETDNKNKQLRKSLSNISRCRHCSITEPGKLVCLECRQSLTLSVK